MRLDRVAAVKEAFLTGYASSGSYSVRPLGLFKLLAFLQRWIDRMSRFTNTVSGPAAKVFQRIRIDPFMRKRLDDVWKEVSL